MITSFRFSKELLSFAPTKEELKGVGLDDSFISEFSLRYICKPIIRQLRFYSNFINALYTNFDISNIAIGMVSFINLPLDLNELFVQFGVVEIDLLCLNKESNEIVILDADNAAFMNYEVAWRCAKSDGQFFEALLFCAKFLTDRMLNDELWNDQKYALEQIKLASEIAGGVEFEDFYRMLLS